MPCAATRASPQPHSHITTTNVKATSACPGHTWVPSEVARHHEHTVSTGQCCSAMAQTIAAPADAVWSLVRRFDNPQGYKRFIRGCRLLDGDGATVGSVREVTVISGLPACSSRERLEILDDERRVFSFRILGGEHRLSNYCSVTTVHEAASPDGPVSMVVESYVVDVPAGNTAEETCIFTDTIVRTNLLNLGHTVRRQIANAA
ncbi:hypothetical protein HU200_025988 [Digitaria exilis]|uniref:Uncharacterized protein n=1 Tax=Digitaria exilis TaxID=1010633 RepID=A0A835EUQ6_9POAL|nr:hypothetical protein HU200_025988 [Digitaria exilis]